MTGAGALDVSLVIATRNRARILAETLKELRCQQVGATRWEVVVVDNGSTDDTPAVLREAAAFLPLVALEEPRPGKNRAMNRALAAVRGDLLLFSDDDVIPDPRWIAEIHAAACRWPGYDVFGGKILLRHPPGTPEWLCEFGDYEAGLPRYAPDAPEGPIDKLPYGPNYAVRAHAMPATRFDESVGPRPGSYPMGSEIELLLRLQRAGATPVYVPSAVVYHVLEAWQLTPWYLARRMFRLGRGMVRLGISHPAYGLRLGQRSRPLLGVPGYLFRNLVLESRGAAAAMLQGPRARLAGALRASFVVGCIAEYRARAREDRS